MDAALPLQPGTALPAARPAAPEAPAARTAEEFEAVFLGTVLDGMLEDAMPKTMGGGIGEQMFTSFLGAEIAKAIVEGGGLGLARSVEARIGAYRR